MERPIGNVLILSTVLRGVSEYLDVCHLLFKGCI